MNESFTPIKLTLFIALGFTLGAFLFFGLSTQQETRKETFQLVGGVCLVGGAILLLVASLQYIFTSKKASVEYLSPPAKSAFREAKKTGGRAELIVISADSWCGFSKKMSAEVPSLQAALNPRGVEVVLVSDQDDKPQFQKLATEHSARGFPHSVLLVEGTKIADIPGYMEASKMVEMVSAKLA